jgi:hypothetical protein
MAQNRITREVDNREFSERPKQWLPPDLLPEPDKEAGYSYRWIRVSMLNQADPRNLASKIREGYEPVQAEEQPKYRLLADPDSRFKNNIEIGGLLLCKIPTEFVEARAKYEQDMTKANADAVDNSFMRQSDHRMPLFQEKKSSVSFGKGS